MAAKPLRKDVALVAMSLAVWAAVIIAIESARDSVPDAVSCW